MYGIFGREITIHTGMYGEYIQFGPTLIKMGAVLSDSKLLSFTARAGRPAGRPRVLSALCETLTWSIQPFTAQLPRVLSALCEALPMSIQPFTLYYKCAHALSPINQ
jgi:hypothetical protein